MELCNQVEAKTEGTVRGPDACGWVARVVGEANLKGLSLKMEISSMIACPQFTLGQCGELGRVQSKALI